MAELTSPMLSSELVPSQDVRHRLAQLADRLYDAVMLIDESWRITYANPMALGVSRLAVADLNSKTLWELYPGVLESPLGQAYLEAVATRSEREVHNFYYDPLKTTFDLHIFPMEGGVGVHYRDVTVVRRAEEARDASDAQLRQVLEATADGVLSIDRAWRVTYANRRAEEMVSPSGDILGKHFWQFFSDAVYEGSPFLEHYYAAMDQGASASFEAFYPQPLNIWVDVTVQPSPDGIILFFRNITERKQREEALLASEERYRVLAELNPQSLWSATPQGLVVYANQRFLEYIGRNFVPVTGEEYIECFDPADHARVIEAWTHSVTTGEDYSIRARLIRASDGASRWWHVWALPVRDADGAILQWLGLATDIHDEHLADTRLREQYAEIDRRRREVEAIYDTSPVGMALYDPQDLRILRINERQAEIFGLHPDQAIGMLLENVTPAMTAVHALVRRAAAGESVLNHSADGFLGSRPTEHRYFNVNYSPVFDENGAVLAVAGAVVETTQQKLAESALIQSEKLAAVGRMASSIAHEINNPLESVTNLLFLARSHDNDSEVQTFLDLADQELRRVSSIASQTLRFHKQASRPREISSVDLLSTVLSLYEGRLRNSHIDVDYRRMTPVRISCFEGDIRQVLNNLVGNAIDAMPTGGRLLLRSRISTHWKTGDTGLTLTVADTGTGIPAATQSRIFEAFFTTKGIAGTGLGLWISTEIMERHHGHLRMRSSQNPAHRGTVFALFLPFEHLESPRN